MPNTHPFTEMIMTYLFWQKPAELDIAKDMILSLLSFYSECEHFRLNCWQLFDLKLPGDQVPSKTTHSLAWRVGIFWAGPNETSYQQVLQMDQRSQLGVGQTSRHVRKVDCHWKLLFTMNINFVKGWLVICYFPFGCTWFPFGHFEVWQLNVEKLCSIWLIRKKLVKHKHSRPKANYVFPLDSFVPFEYV